MMTVRRMYTETQRRVSCVRQMTEILLIRAARGLYTTYTKYTTSINSSPASVCDTSCTVRI